MPKANTKRIPKARTSDLVVKQLPGEVIVYDLKREKAHCLNQTAALVWKRCNGRRTVADLVSALEKDLHAPVDEQVVQLALYQLDKNHLLSPCVYETPWSSRISRRDVVKKLGWTTVVALPMITSIIAPTAASAATCIADNQCKAANVGKCCCDARRTCQQVLVLFLCAGSTC